jgi:hypothetical protein
MQKEKVGERLALDEKTGSLFALVGIPAHGGTEREGQSRAARESVFGT